MSSLRPFEKSKFEKLLGLSTGYVLGSTFTDSTFGSFFAEVAGVDIHSERYRRNGASKGRKLRAFWELEPDHLVGKVLSELIEIWATGADPDPEHDKLSRECRAIAKRLLGGNAGLADLKAAASILDAHHLTMQIRRMEESVHNDPALAIGTAKELIETVCKTILAERGKPMNGAPDIPTLTKATLNELDLVPDSVDEAKRGSEAIKRVLRSLGSIGNDLNELRGIYGTGHGKDGKAKGLLPRHAKLAVGAAATFATFLFETHRESGSAPSVPKEASCAE